jgi:hypothetical protein
MEAKGREPLREQPEDIGTIEAENERENQQEDEVNVEALEQTSKDYWGRRSQETDGAVPTDPPDVDPLAQQHLDKPKGPPKHNM